MRYGAQRALIDQVRQLDESIAELEKAIDRENSREARNSFNNELRRMVNLRPTERQD